jgi:hypothetical protein
VIKTNHDSTFYAYENEIIFENDGDLPIAFFIRHSKIPFETTSKHSETSTHLNYSKDVKESIIREENKKIASKQKRKTSYIANILVINDPAKPENNGKVFLFKFGKKIFDKIMDKARPTFEDEKPVLVFDLWEGANFKLRIRNVEGYRNYDKSEFESETPLLDGDEEKLVSLINTQHKLAEFLDREKNFKSYDALKKRLDEVLSGAGAVTKSAAKIAEDEDDLSSLAAPASRSVEAPAAKAKAAPIEDDDDDALSYFQKMAQE